MEALPIKPNILIVDDSRTVRDVMADEIKSLGYNVQVAGSGEEALKIIRQELSRIGFIFLDMRLPGVSGLELVNKIIALKPDITIVIMTSYESPDSSIDIGESGVHGFALKPIEPRYIEGYIRRAVKLQQYISYHKQLSAALKGEVNELCQQLGKPPRYKSD